MMMGFNHFAEIGLAFEGLSKLVADQTAVDAQEAIRAQMDANGQVDTGYMRDSVYTITSKGSDYQAGEHALPEADQPEDGEAIVAVAADYGGYQNYGTRYIPPRPFFEPGIQAASDALEGHFQEAAAGLEAI